MDMKFLVLSPEIPNVYRYYIRNASRIDYSGKMLGHNVSTTKGANLLREEYFKLGLNEDGTMTKGTFLKELEKGRGKWILTYVDETRDPIADGTSGNFLADGYMVLVPGAQLDRMLISDFIVFEQGIGRGKTQYAALEEYVKKNYPKVKELYGCCPFKKSQPFWKKMGFVFDTKDPIMGMNSKKL